MVEAFGSLKAASSIVIIIDGTHQSINRWDSKDGWARPNAKAIMAKGNSMGAGQVAAIAWLGYDSPNGGFPAGMLAEAGIEGGGNLANFVKGFRSKLGGKRIVIAGQSCGSVVVGEAMKQGGPADAAIVTGSPGIRADNAGAFGAAGKFYVGKAADDTFNDGAFLGMDPHGADPSKFSDARLLDVGNASGHDQYYQGGTSGCSIAAVVVGRAEERNGRWGAPAGSCS